MRVVKLPGNLAVAADYGVAVRSDAPPPARDFAAYLRSPAGVRVLTAYGFDPP